MTNDYGIGSDTWPGLAKLMEEMGELQQVLGKIMACDKTDAIYWDGSSLLPNLTEELGDVQAALLFFTEANAISGAKVQARAEGKLDKFNHWHRQARAPEPTVVHTLLMLVQAELPAGMPELEVVEQWSPDEREEVARWAATLHLQASDHGDLVLPEVPEVLTGGPGD